MLLTKGERKQLQLISRISPVKRFKMMTDLIGAQVDAMKAGVLHDNPNASESELRKCLRERLTKIYSSRH